MTILATFSRRLRSSSWSTISKYSFSSGYARLSRSSRSARPPASAKLDWRCAQSECTRCAHRWWSAFVQRCSSLGDQFRGISAGRILQTQRGVRRGLRMVFVGRWRPKQRENPIAGRLHDVAVVATDRVDHQLERGVDDDAPGSLGCPLLPPPPYQPPSINCQKVCQEYTGCRNRAGVEAGFTCDATLCTGQCNDRDLVSRACAGLTTNGRAAPVCNVNEIAKAEAAAGCSCCASQLCGCDANTRTEHAIYQLDAAQRARGIDPQCDHNGTLCGTAP